MDAKKGPMPEVPADVAAYAAQKGVSAFLPGVLGLARELFPNEPMSVAMHHDREIADLHWIEIGVRVPWDTDYAAVRPKYEEFHRRMLGVCPATHLHAFTLDVDATP